MANTTRKDRIKVSPAQKLEYTKLMIEDNYSNQQIIDLSGASSSAVYNAPRNFIVQISWGIIAWINLFTWLCDATLP